MSKAIEIAKLGEGRVSPNPLVGAIVVKKGRIISVGYHGGPGTPHAERMALDLAGEHTKGACLYINLEPCVHYGRTPPCAPYIVSKKIKRVIIGNIDPDERVNGKGIEFLKKNGVEVKTGVLEEACRELNRFYFTYKLKKRPFITLKFAMTLNGKIALKNGTSKWISSEEERKFLHYIRGNYDAIVIGKGTFLKDNPLLTPRKVYSFRRPYRFVLWGNKDFEFKNYRFFRGKRGFIVVSEDYRGKKGDFMLKIEGKGRINLRNFLKKLYEMGVTSVLVEGGKEVLSSFIKEELFDEIHTSYSGKIAGEGISPLTGLKLEKFFGEFGIKEIKKFEKDIYIIWRRKYENKHEN